MIVTYNANGQIMSVTRNEERSKLIKGSPYLILELDEVNGNIDALIDLVLNREAYHIEGGVLFKGASPVSLTSDTDWSEFKTTYQNSMARLDQIATSGTIPFTQAGFNLVVQAVKDIALFLKLTIKILVKNFIL